MKILVIGAGAVGGYFGGRLARSGACDVTFAARGKTLEVLEEQGLRVKSVEGDFVINPVKTARLDTVREAFDLVLVCVKSYHLEEICGFLPGLRKGDTPVISLLNGLGSEQAIARAVGSEHALAGVAYVGALALSPAVIVHSSLGFLKVGRLDGQGDERLEAFSSICHRAGVRCDVSRNIVRELWKKLLWNASFNAVTALGRSVTSEVLAVPDAESVIKEAMDEIVRVAEAHHIRFDDGVVEKMIQNTRERDPIRTSMQDDVELAKRNEADALNGAVVALAAAKNIPVPVNRTLYGLLKLLDENAKQKLG